jgi:hypothetical protein
VRCWPNVAMFAPRWQSLWRGLWFQLNKQNMSRTHTTLAKLFWLLTIKLGLPASLHWAWSTSTHSFASLNSAIPSPWVKKTTQKFCTAVGNKSSSDGTYSWTQLILSTKCLITCPRTSANWCLSKFTKLGTWCMMLVSRTVIACTLFWKAN